VSELLELAARIAREAGALQRARFREPREIGTKSSPTDLVTDVDHACDALIGQRIREARPQDGVLSEELGERAGASDVRWVVDPLDGTTNYAHGLPIYSVSIALACDGKVEVGAVYQPVLDEMFTATAGGGARLNGERISVSREAELAHSLLVTGFPYDMHETERDNLEYFRRFVKRARAVRRLGSAALDLCYVACGRFDGSWELKLSPWDVAAGALIAREAGATVTAMDGGPFDPFEGTIIASNGLVHKTMETVLSG
jgi:myo-inositol-1(or 4)-monophosphatase